jgi:beta-1,4-mannooligosaccharide/beta-1,4-mannosyl-N-acetylglucosamine phosphorylase
MKRAPSPMVVKGEAIPNIPWEEKPAECSAAVWRSSLNPIVPRDLLPNSNSIFNSAVVKFKGEFAGVFRMDATTRFQNLMKGRSSDGIRWKIDPEPIKFISNTPEQYYSTGYDPRVCWLEDRYYVTWCNQYHGPTIGVAWTRDFEKFHLLENAFLPFNRNGVLFPRRIRGKYAMLSRPSGPGHNTFGSIFYSESPDMTYWGKHRLVMEPRSGWDSAKIGAGPTPIETKEGWLMIYHGVLISCSGFVYSAGAALLNLDEPWKVIARAKPYLWSPQRLYECVGDTPNVVFPCAALCDAPTGRLAVYYGCADTCIGLAFAQVDELVDFVKKNAG